MLWKGPYQDGGICIADFPVDCAQTQRQYNIDDKTEPIITDISSHVYKRPPSECQTLLEKACLTSIGLQNSSLLQKPPKVCEFRDCKSPEDPTGCSKYCICTFLCTQTVKWTSRDDEWKNFKKSMLDLRFVRSHVFWPSLPWHSHCFGTHHIESEPPAECSSCPKDPHFPHPAPTTCPSSLLLSFS